MLESLAEMVGTLAPIVFPLVMLSQLLLGGLGFIFKLFTPPKIKFHPAGMIELGVDTMGPTISLFGTMQAQRRNFFITKIEVEAYHEVRKSVDTFEWRAFTPYVFGFQLEEDVKYELVSAFALKTSEPFKYNIVFIDDSFIEEVSDEARRLVEDWKIFRAQSNMNGIGVSGVSSAEPSHEIRPNSKDERYIQLESFYQQEQIQEIAQAWKDRIKWFAGPYQLTVNVYGAQYKAKHQYQFQLSEKQAETLRNNVKQIIFALCGERPSYSKAYVSYEANN
ncbi:MAG: hypothetical protein AAF702_31565 [Chloroflexota bacterium]